jgi:pimeloyl-ACP methyl ester carboxylesterase
MAQILSCPMSPDGLVRQHGNRPGSLKEAAMTEPETYTLDAPGAVLTYDIRAGDPATEPFLLLIGSPMGAFGFTTLAGYFPDRTVVTYDPRGAERSKRTDGALVTTPDEHADDLHRLITALGAGPVDMFASSGGAVNALALLAQYPEQVRTLVAHEPPAAQVLPDREPVLAAAEAIHETYIQHGFGPAMARFIALASYQGPVPAGFADQPGPDPASFGLPAGDDGSRDDPLVGQNMPSCLAYQHDFGALRTASARIVLAVGKQSGAGMAGRAAVAVAQRLGVAPVSFPGGHDGFLGSEYGGSGDPQAFAATLREVLG